MKKLVLPGLVMVGLLAAAPFAFAQTGPDTDACTQAEASLAVAVAATVEFDPAVYPGDVPPVVGAVTPGLLQGLLDGGELGEGAQAEVQAALAAFAARDEACEEPPVTPTPTPTPTPGPTPGPTTTVPLPDLDCDDLTRSEAQAILDANPQDPNRLDLDGDGTACELDPTNTPDDDGGFDQVGELPVAIDTGRA